MSSSERCRPLLLATAAAFAALLAPSAFSSSSVASAWAPSHPIRRVGRRSPPPLPSAASARGGGGRTLAQTSSDSGSHLRDAALLALPSDPRDGDASADAVGRYDPLRLSSGSDREGGGGGSSATLRIAAVAAASAILSVPGEASAAAVAAPGAVSSALVAYGHYLSTLILTGSIMTERLTVKPAMSIDEENRLAVADIVTGVAGVGLLASGYYRATVYGKGWDYYSHEPIFWLKMTFLGVFGALSLFPTTIIVKRSVEIQKKRSIDPMSERLANRLTSVLNAEISALALIPLTATLMSRGVGYVDDFPTEIVGPAVFGIVTAGGAYKYVGEAFGWDEDEGKIMVVGSEQLDVNEDNKDKVVGEVGE